MKPYYETESGKLYCGDALDVLKQLPDEIVQCVITSPPYWGLRDYGVEGQLGLEKTPEEYIEKMVVVFRGVKRVLRNDGTLWLNMGDCYTASGGNTGNGRPGFSLERGRRHDHRQYSTLKPKDLVGMPWRLALALQADGWYLRSDIIWSKPNPMPESVTDRPTKAHSYVFLMSRQAKYYYDADAVREVTGSEANPEHYGGKSRHDHSQDTIAGQSQTKTMPTVTHPHGRNKRDVWTIPTQPFPGAHFATFPEKLVIPCMKAGTSEKGNCSVCGKPWVRVVEATKYKPLEAKNGERFVDKSRGDKNRKLSGSDYNKQVKTKTIGWQPSCTCDADTVQPIVLDPFMGSGTVAKVCEKYGRGWIGIELSQEYCDIAVKRLKHETAQYKLDLINAGADA